MLAKHALSQLSYGPDRERPELVGPDRFELSTSRLSSARSNQLSYKPERARHGAGRLVRWRVSAVADPRHDGRKRNEDGGVPPNGSLIKDP